MISTLSRLAVLAACYRHGMSTAEAQAMLHLLEDVLSSEGRRMVLAKHKQE